MIEVHLHSIHFIVWVYWHSWQWNRWLLLFAEGDSVYFHFYFLKEKKIERGELDEMQSGNILQVMYDHTVCNANKEWILILKLPMTNSKSCLPLKTMLYTNSFLYITSFRHVNITITNDSRCCGNYKITCYQTNQREYSQRYYAMANASDIIKQKSAFCLVCTCCSVDHVCYVAFW